MSPQSQSPASPRVSTPSSRDDNLPPIWNLRAARRTDFSGRDEELNALRTLLRKEHVVLVTEGHAPIGGLGKSGIAREFAYRFASDYQVVWWLQGDDAGPMQLVYGQLMSAVSLLRQTPDESPYSVSEIQAFLAAHGGWLLIVDGLERLDELDTLLPEKPGGHVIVTTCLGAAASTHATHAIEPLEEAECQAYLKLHFSDADEASLHALGRQSAGHPLCLHLMSHLARVRNENATEILAFLETLLPEPLRGGPAPEVAKGLIRALVRALVDHLANSRKEYRDFVHLCAYLAPHDIPEFLFDLKESEEPLLSQRLTQALASRKDRDRMLSELETFGLIERHQDSFSLHQLVQEAVREAMNPDAAKAWANAAVRLTVDAFPDWAAYDRPTPVCTRLLPHALACTQWAEELKVGRECSAQLLYQCGLYLHGCRVLDEAKTAYQLSISLGQKALGVKHPTIATRINSLGIVEHELGNLQEARDCFERAFDICEAVYGPLEEAVYGAPDDKLLTIPITNLCTILEEMGDIDAAQQTYEKAMRIYLEVYGWNHPMVAQCADRFGRTWHKLGRLAKARNCFEKAVLAEESAAEPDTGNLATFLNNLATVQMEMNEAELAHERLSRALRLDKHNHGEHHPAVARDLANLANACRMLRQLDDAEQYYTDALAMIETLEGEETAHTTALLNHLGVVLLDNHKASQARTCLERALATNETLCGPESPEVMRNLTNLGRALEELEAHSQAMNCFERALHVSETRTPGESESTATILYRIGRSLHRQSEHVGALNYFERAMKMDTKLFGRQHTSVARDAYAAGSVLAEMNDTVVAMGHLTLSLDIYEAAVGKSDPRTRKVRNKLEEIGG